MSPPLIRKLCRSCAESSKATTNALRVKRIMEGMCRECGKPALPGLVRCETHWFKHKAVFHMGSARYADDLRHLAEAQGWRCWYTGEPITPGVNMSLDHMTPKTHPNYPGDNQINNLVWTTPKTNTAKNDKSYDEFIEFCRSVVRAHEDRVSLRSVACP